MSNTARPAAVLVGLVLLAGTPAVNVAAAGETATATDTAGIVTVSPPGIPAVLDRCASTLWNYQSDLAFTGMLDLGGAYFVDNVSLSFDVSGCENANGGAGSVVDGSMTGGIEITGTNVSCTLTGGTYSRQGVIFTMSAPSSCTVNGVPAQTTFDVNAAWAPAGSPLQGTLSTITMAALAGTVTSTP